MTSDQPFVPPVNAVFGEEFFLKRQAVKGIVARALRDDPDSMGPTRVDGETAELADALDELQTPSLLGGCRVVIVEDADTFITRYRKQLEAYCSKPAQGACLVLVCRSLPRNTRLHKQIAARGEVFECAVPKGRQVSAWIVQRGRQTYSKAIDGDAVARLRDLVGGSLEALDNELAKLAVYVGGRPAITLEDVETLVGLRREEAVFRVTDAMSAGDTAGALKAWGHVLTTDRAAPMRAIGGLASAIRRLLEAKQAADAGRSPEALAPRFEPARSLFIRRLNSVTVGQLQQQLSDLHQADLATKTGLTDVAHAVETFIVKHAATARAPAGTPTGGYQG